MKLAGTGCFSHNFLRKEQPEPIALFPMVRACTLFRRVLAYVMEVRRGLNIGRSMRPTACPITEGTKPQVTSIYLKAQSN